MLCACFEESSASTFRSSPARFLCRHLVVLASPSATFPFSGFVVRTTLCSGYVPTERGPLPIPPSSAIRSCCLWVLWFSLSHFIGHKDVNRMHTDSYVEKYDPAKSGLFRRKSFHSMTRRPAWEIPKGVNGGKW